MRFADVAAPARRRRLRRTLRRRGRPAARRISSEHGWDGDWYRRAYFDDGTPLGSATNAECQIDSLAAELGGAVRRRRPGARAPGAGAARAPAGASRCGADPALRSALRQVDLDPGYIKGYLPGVRENGGQYTHAAIWAVMAFAAQGDAERAWELSRMINPVHHGDSAEGSPLQGRALRGRRGRLRHPAAHRARRLDLVHRLGGLDVPPHHRVPARPAARGRPPALDPLLPRAWGGFDLHYRYYQSTYHIHVRNLGGDAAP